MAVQGACDQFLAGAGLAGDQYRQRRLRQPSDGPKQVTHHWCLADQFGGVIADLRRRLRRRPAFGFEGPASHCYGCIQVKRLAKEVVGPAFEGTRGAGDVGVGAHHHYRQILASGLEGVEQAETVHFRHPHVGEHQ